MFCCILKNCRGEEKEENCKKTACSSHHSPDQLDWTDQLNWSNVPNIFELKKIDRVLKTINLDKGLKPVLFSTCCAVVRTGTTTASSPHFFFKDIFVDMPNFYINHKNFTLPRNEP